MTGAAYPVAAYPFSERPVLNYVDGAFVEGDGW